MGTFQNVVEGNMEQLRAGDQVLRYDRERTRKAYAAIKSSAAEKCGCVFCRNYTAQHASLFPESFRQLLDLLGVDPEKEVDVHQEFPEGPLWQYGGWFYLTGELLEAGERLTDCGSGFQYFFRGAGPMSDFGDALVLEFYARLPWVIGEPPEWP